MADKKIIWSRRAKKEFKNTLEFYSKRNDNPNYSLKILTEVEILLKTLSKNAFIGRLASNKITRVIPMKYYLIFYELNKNQIEIVSFWDNRQSPGKRII